MLPTVNVARGCAALAVLLFHMTVRVRTCMFWGVGWSGTHGVDLFFVISGFIMVYTTHGQRGVRQAWRFARRRVVRIYPPYWIVALVVWQTGLYAMPRDPVATFLLYDQMGAAILPQAWTMGIEMAFYTFFLSAFFLPAWAFGALSAWWAARCAYNALWPWSADYLITSVVINFFYGVLVGYAVLWRKGTRVHGGWVCLAAAALMALCILDHAGYVPKANSVVTYGPLCAVLIGVGVLYDLHTRPTYPRWMMMLGDASYAIYLIHYVELDAVNYVLRHYVYGHTPEVLLTPIVLMCGAAIVTSGVLYHHWVELPAVRLAKRCLMLG